MPFDNPSVNEARRHAIDPAARRYGFATLRVDEGPRPSTITAATHDRIASADFVVADLSGARPNCYYEVGYAQALSRPLIFLIKTPEKPHFDIAGYPFIEYSSSDELRPRLESEILNQVLTSHATPSDPGDNVGHFGGCSFVDPYIVTGRVRVDVEGAERRERSFFVDLRVRSIDPQRPVMGPVTFVLHRDFGANRRQTFVVDDGEFELIGIPVAGTFTVGVILRRAQVNLELDLSRLPGATSEFRAW
jgi:hypothetical protein